jgi:hypothetical protein
VSDEAEGLIEKTFLTGLRAEYPFIKAKDVVKKFGIKFLPATWVLDANGSIVTLPDVGPPDDTLIETLLQGLPVEPRVPEGAKFEPLRQLWLKGDFARLQDHLDKTLGLPKLDDDLRAACEGQKEALAKKQERTLARLAQLGQGPDYTAQFDELEAIEKAWPGLPPAAKAREVLDRFEADDKIKVEIATGHELWKLLNSVDTSRLPALRKVIEDLDKFRKKHEGTYAGEQARLQHARLCARPKPE